MLRRLLVTAVGIGFCAVLAPGGEPCARLLLGVRPGVRVETPLAGPLELSWMLPGEAGAAIQRWSRGSRQEARNASLDRCSGEIIPHQWGWAPLILPTLSAALDASGGEKVPLAQRAVAPSWSEGDLASLTDRLSTFSTRVTGEQERISNIQLGARLLNNLVVEPERTFSFWRELGPPSESRGFKEAPVIVAGELVPGLGGGLCQVSTTLYNAVSSVSGLHVKERHSHSRAVDYVQEGQDAAVAYDYLDFRFVNHRAMPVVIKARLERDRLIFDLWGKNK